MKKIVITIVSVLIIAVIAIVYYNRKNEQTDKAEIKTENVTTASVSGNGGANSNYLSNETELRPDTTDDSKPKGKVKPNQPNPFAKADIKVNVIPGVDNTFGYEIVVNDKPMIRQANIPGVPGNAGFKTKEDAKKVGNFIVKKMRHNEMPPSVTQEDLKKLGVMK